MTLAVVTMIVPHDEGCVDVHSVSDSLAQAVAGQRHSGNNWMENLGGCWRMLIGEKERTEGDQGAHEMRTLEKSGRRGDVFIANILPIREVEKIITQGSG